MCMTTENRVTCSITKGVIELISVYMTLFTVCPDMTKNHPGRYICVWKNQFKAPSEISPGLYAIV